MTHQKEVTHYRPSYITLDEYVRGAWKPLVTSAVCVGAFFSVLSQVYIMQNGLYMGHPDKSLVMAIAAFTVPFVLIAGVGVPIYDYRLRRDWNDLHSAPAVRQEFITRDDVELEVADPERIYPLNGVDITYDEGIKWYEYIYALSHGSTTLSESNAREHGIVGRRDDNYIPFRDRLLRARVARQNGTNYEISNAPMLRQWCINFPLTLEGVIDHYASPSGTDEGTHEN